MLKYLERHFEGFDQSIAVLGAGAFYLYSHRLGDRLLLDLLHGVRPVLYPLIAGVFATFFAFGMAAISIVLGFSNSGRLYVARASTHWATLWRVFTTALWVSLLCSATAVVALVLDKENDVKPFVSYFLLLLTIFGFLKMYRVVDAFSRIIKIMVRPIDDAKLERSSAELELIAH
jgi:hypothetical protein